MFNGKVVKILSASKFDKITGLVKQADGELFIHNRNKILSYCDNGRDIISLEKIKLPGKKALTAIDIINGNLLF